MVALVESIPGEYCRERVSVTLLPVTFSRATFDIEVSISELRRPVAF